jgi:epoxyqueuosine reductase
MSSQITQNLSGIIIKKALSIGASLVGIASVDSIRNSPSHQNSSEDRWPSQAKSVVVLALKHDTTEPSLDWWDGNHGTAGNRMLISITRQLKRWLRKKYRITATDVPYYIHKGGIFLKDSAVCAGLGIIGKNNLLITPEYGPRVRLRALFVNVQLDSTYIHNDFKPCENCDMPCRKACPQEAFRSNSYDRSLCLKQMEKDEIESAISKDTGTMYYSDVMIKYCRACELACSEMAAGRNQKI